MRMGELKSMKDGKEIETMTKKERLQSILNLAMDLKHTKELQSFLERRFISEDENNG